ncbi:MAG: hypothetical protein ABFD64_00365 [Armatimonadota bacterium]
MASLRACIWKVSLAAAIVLPCFGLLATEADTVGVENLTILRAFRNSKWADWAYQN